MAFKISSRSAPKPENAASSIIRLRLVNCKSTKPNAPLSKVWRRLGRLPDAGFIKPDINAIILELVDGCRI